MTACVCVCVCGVLRQFCCFEFSWIAAWIHRTLCTNQTIAYYIIASQYIICTYLCWFSMETNGKCSSVWRLRSFAHWRAPKLYAILLDLCTHTTNKQTNGDAVAIAWCQRNQMLWLSFFFLFPFICLVFYSISSWTIPFTYFVQHFSCFFSFKMYK